jgi:hypothetical protein
MKEAKKTLLRLIGLIWIFAAAVIVVGMIVRIAVAYPVLPYILGELLGSTVSTLLMLHRYSTLEVELDLERKKAVGHSRVMASLRAIAALIVLFVSFWWPSLFWPVTTFAGLFATKLAALLYPVFFRQKTA